MKVSINSDSVRIETEMRGLIYQNAGEFVGLLAETNANSIVNASQEVLEYLGMHTLFSIFLL